MAHKSRLVGLLKITTEAILIVTLVISCGPVYDINPPEPEDELLEDGQPIREENETTGKCNAREQKLYSDNAHFTNVFRECAHDTWGKSWQTIICIREGGYQKLRTSCATCFGEFAACGKRNCKAACFWDYKSKKCKDCGERYCGPNWEECSGSQLGDLAD